MAKTSRTLVIRLLFMISTLGFMTPSVFAQDVTAPSQVVDNYLASLVTGNTQQLVTLIDGPMLRSNRQLVVKPDKYSEFLRKHYAGVQATVEEIEPSGDQMRARVRFDYPSTDSTEIVFILKQLDGQWKITDELF